MEEDIDSVIRKLIIALSSNDDLVRTRARKALETIGEAAVPFLAEALVDPDNIRRWEAAKTLVDIGGPSVAPALVRALENEEFEVRWLAAKGLIETKTEGLKPLLEALTEHGDSVLLREGARHVLHELAKEGAREYLHPLLVALEGQAPEMEVPIKALQTLESIEKLQEAARLMNKTLLRRFPALSQRIEYTDPRRRVRRYVRLHRNV